MATHATAAKVATLRTALLVYATAITHTVSATQTVLQARAVIALDLYADALLAVLNINASAATGYSNAVGFSTQKRRLADAQDAADRYLGEFVSICALGGQTVPTTGDDAASLWDLSGFSHG